ncbi:MAG: mucoidy inhibitor MuiA family protein [Myxococcales bacterium]
MLAPLAFAAALSAALPVPAPITSVTVFGDRARVVRSAALPAGAAEVTFPVLPQAADRDSVRLEVHGASLQRVQLGDVPPEAFPAGPGQKLLTQLLALDDRIAAVEGEAAAVRQALDLLRGAAPSGDPPPPAATGRRAPLDPSGWAAAMAFDQSAAASLRGRLQKLDQSARKLREQRALVADQARLLGATQRPSGLLVTAWVHGGPGRATLTYDVSRARWRPLYDVQLDPAKSEVRLSLAGLVSQQTGEDWTAAKLTLSTAVPATASSYPDLPVWKIGERDRFVPTPGPHPLPLAPPPPAPPLPEEADRALLLRQRLLALAAAPPPSGPQDKSGEAGPITTGVDVRRAPWEQNPPSADRDENAGPPAPQPMPPPPAPPQEIEERMEAPIARAPRPLPKAAFLASEAAPSLPLGPPVRYRPPYVPPDYPAALAGGYDLEYPSLRPETVPSGGGERRVALLSRRFPVRLTRELFPALTQAAFLVAELGNDGADPIAGGPAELFVGDDPAGNARLPLVAPGERFTLPLGVDRAVQPVRRVDLVQGEKGFFSRDDVRSYRVTIELANPYPRPIDVHVVDQWPVTHDEHVQGTLDEVAPEAARNPEKGELDWQLTVPPASKQILDFAFTVRCPKGWLLGQ